MFKSNVGGIDRVLRIVAGLVLLAMFFVYPDASWRWFTLIGVIPLFTGLFGTCPALLDDRIVDLSGEEDLIHAALMVRIER